MGTLLQASHLERKSEQTSKINLMHCTILILPAGNSVMKTEDRVHLRALAVETTLLTESTHSATYCDSKCQ